MVGGVPIYDIMSGASNLTAAYRAAAAVDNCGYVDGCDMPYGTAYECTATYSGDCLNVSGSRDITMWFCDGAGEIYPPWGCQQYTNIVSFSIA